MVVTVELRGHEYEPLFLGDGEICRWCKHILGTEDKGCVTLPYYWVWGAPDLGIVIEAYAKGGRMRAKDIAALRGYLEQYIGSEVWIGRGVAGLREGVGSLTTRGAIKRWLRAATRLGIAPL